MGIFSVEITFCIVVLFCSCLSNSYLLFMSFWSPTLKLYRKSQHPHPHPRTRFRITQCVMMICQIETAMQCHSRQPMIRQLFPENLSRSAKCAMKFVIGVIHLIHFVNGTQTAFIKCAIVRHQRQTLDFRRDFCPNGGENSGVFGIFKRDSENYLIYSPCFSQQAPFLSAAALTTQPQPKISLSPTRNNLTKPCLPTKKWAKAAWVLPPLHRGLLR